MPNFPNYDSSKELKLFLEQFGFGMQKKFGQNFLIDRKIREELILILNIEPEQKVWEIGPGLGAMTYLILNSGANLTAFEIDRGFVGILKNIFSTYKNFKVIEGDVQKTWFQNLEEKGKPDIFFGNLPYNIATDLILDTINKLIIFDKMLITVQTEVAQKIIAKPNTKNYGIISVLCNWLYDCKIVKNISSSAFWPQPHIQSSAVFFKSKKDYNCKNPKLMIKIVKALFSSRRKTIKNNLESWLKSNGYSFSTDLIFEKTNLKDSLRAENLSLYNFLKLSDIICSIGNTNEE